MSSSDDPARRRRWLVAAAVSFVLAAAGAGLVANEVVVDGATFLDVAGPTAVVMWMALVWPVHELVGRRMSAAPAARPAAAPAAAPDAQPLAADVPEVAAPEVDARFVPDPAVLERHARLFKTLCLSLAVCIAVVVGVMAWWSEDFYEGLPGLIGFVGALLVPLLVAAGATWLFDRWRSRRHLAGFEMVLEETILRVVRPGLLSRKGGVDLTEVAMLRLTQGDTGWATQRHRLPTEIEVVHRNRWTPEIILVSGHVPRAVFAPLEAFLREVAEPHGIEVVVRRQDPPRWDFL